MPYTRRSLGMTTAPIVSGPAQEPLPTSSMPTTTSHPRSQSSRSADRPGALRLWAVERAGTAGPYPRPVGRSSTRVVAFAVPFVHPDTGRGHEFTLRNGMDSREGGPMVRLTTGRVDGIVDLSPGTPVEVRRRFDRAWARGFEVIDVSD